MEKKWKVLEAKNIFSTAIMKLRFEKCELPDGRIMPKYYVVDFPDWVHIVAMTTTHEIILLRQYRHAARESFWEIPGGTLDPGSSESPLEAAKRELQEETGFTSQNWKSIGIHSPNPAIQTNKLHTYLALDCVKTHDLNLDPFEDLEVHLMPYQDAVNMLETGQFTHSLMMSSLVLTYPFLRNKISHKK